MSTDLILVAGGLCTAGLAIVGMVKYVVRPIWRLVKALNLFLEDWNGEPARPGRARRPSMPERMQAVERQVTPNGGNTSSLADQVVRIARFVGLEI